MPWARHGEGSGSGYRLGQRLVLTAPHVITSAMGPTGGQLLVRVPEWLPAEPIWDDEDADAALRADGESIGEMERSFGVSRATGYRALQDSGRGGGNVGHVGVMPRTRARAVGDGRDEWGSG